MKNTLNTIGWILFLALAVAALLVYNVAYVPKDNKIVRLKQEINMWTIQVQSLTDSLKRLTTGADTLLRVSFTWDELFRSTDSFKFSPLSDAALRELVPKLKTTPGTIIVTGHTDNRPVPEHLRPRYGSNWEFGAGAAAAVARLLITWGAPAQRIIVASAAETRPVADNTSAEGRSRNRRVEIIIRSQ